MPCVFHVQVYLVSAGVLSVTEERSICFGFMSHGICCLFVVILRNFMRMLVAGAKDILPRSDLISLKPLTSCCVLLCLTVTIAIMLLL